LCGRPKCPILFRVEAMKQVAINLENKEEMFGSTPPSTLVGEWNYPQIYVGGLIPPEIGDNAAFFDSPRLWLVKGVTLDEIIRLRSSMVNSRTQVHVRDAAFPRNKVLERIQEMVISSRPIDVEVHFEKRPRFRFTFDGIITPVGVTAHTRDLILAQNPSVPRVVDRIVCDYDLKASQAILKLYSHGIDVYHIQRLLSTGLLGIKKQRRIVPTRWSITAVDKIIGDFLLKEVKCMPLINEILLFHHEYLGNHYEILLIPRPYSFEMIEIWMPRSVWVSGKNPSVFVNWELHDGRAQEMDGGYYAVRLPVLEYLRRIKRQACVIAVREIRPEYYAPVGNWQIRENVRAALSRNPEVFDDVREAIARMSSRLKTSLHLWLPKSYLLKLLEKQTILDSFLR